MVEYYTYLFALLWIGLGFIFLRKYITIFFMEGLIKNFRTDKYNEDQRRFLEKSCFVVGVVALIIAIKVLFMIIF